MTSNNRLAYHSLCHILDDLTNLIAKTKQDISFTSEDTLKEIERLEQKRTKIKVDILEYIKRNHLLVDKLIHVREKLSYITKHIDNYKEEDVAYLYGQIENYQNDIERNQEREQELQQHREQIEEKINDLKKKVAKATEIGRKVSVLLNFLQDNEANYPVLGNDDLHVEKEQQIGIQIIEAQELERKRLSREIHDGPAQMLANILLRSEIIDLCIKEGKTEEAIEEYRDVRSHIHSALKEVRRIIYNLRPMALDDLGIVPTIKKHVSTLSETYNIDIELQLIGEERRLQSNYEVAVFRIIQEALQNALKHAEAKKIVVTLELLTTQINILIKDDGKGFVINHQKLDSFGLIGMKERVDMLNGTFNIESNTGLGTTINISLPYDVAE